MVQTIEKIKAAKSPKALLADFLATHKVKVSNSFEELLGPDLGLSKEDIRDEVDDLANLRKEWRTETPERNLD